jgi:hypothetical protein
LSLEWCRFAECSIFLTGRLSTPVRLTMRQTHGALPSVRRRSGKGNWTLRAGVFDLSNVPNSPHLDLGLHEFQIDSEIEHRHELREQAVSFHGYSR